MAGMTPKEERRIAQTMIGAALAAWIEREKVEVDQMRGIIATLKEFDSTRSMTADLTGILVHVDTAVKIAERFVKNAR